MQRGEKMKNRKMVLGYCFYIIGGIVLISIRRGKNAWFLGDDTVFEMGRSKRG